MPLYPQQPPPQQQPAPQAQPPRPMPQPMPQQPPQQMPPQAQPQPQPLRAGVRQALYPVGEGPKTEESAQAGEPASPEEQAQYSKVVTKILGHVMRQGDKAIKAMRPVGQEAPEDAIGRFAATLVRGFSKTVKRQGMDVTPDVQYNAGVEIIEHLVDLAHTAKLVPDDDEQTKEKALLAALKTEVDRQRAEGNPHQQEAADFYTQKVAEEVDSGQAKQGFLNTAQGSDGQQQALQPGSVP